jgi:hypothetical protein
MPRAYDYFSHEAIRSGVEKVLNVWESRAIMNAEQVKLLKEKLDNPTQQNGSGKFFSLILSLIFFYSRKPFFWRAKRIRLYRFG